MFTQTIDMFDLYKWKETKLFLDFLEYLMLLVDFWMLPNLLIFIIMTCHVAFRYSKLYLNTALFNSKVWNKNAER